MAKEPKVMTEAEMTSKMLQTIITQNEEIQHQNRDLLEQNDEIIEKLNNMSNPAMYSDE